MPRKKQRRISFRKPAKEHLKDMFSLHKSERRGILVLMMILAILIGWVVYEQWFYQQPTTDLAPVEQEFKEWLARRNAPQMPDTLPVAEAFPFDPNTISRDEWVALGLSEKQADGVLRYRDKGGKFRIKSDVSRMYTVSPELYERLEPFILLPDSHPKVDRQKREFADRPARTFQKDTFSDRREPAAWKERTYERAPVEPLDVNTADTTSLVTLPGIGPAFARGIVKYRESLGGYISMDQLAEVYVLRDKPDAVERLKEILFLGNAPIRKIRINEASPDEFAAHPYISWKVANGLVNYRRQHGPFPTVEAIRGSVLVNDSLYQRIQHYLTVDP